MFHELEPGNYEKAGPVLESLDIHLTLDSILSGLSPAKIFVDDIESPTAVFTWYKGKTWLAGNADNDAFNASLDSYIRETYFDMLRTHEATGFRLHCDPSWEKALDRILVDQEKYPFQRLYYRLDSRSRTWSPEPPEGFEVRQVDSGLLVDGELSGLDDVREEMVSERLSVEEFLEKSFGYVVTHGGRVVGFCMSEYNTGNRCELGIATNEAYQRRGLAKLTAAATILHALAAGIDEIGWHCAADNVASVATAESLGFERAAEYRVHWVSI